MPNKPKATDGKNPQLEQLQQQIDELTSQLKQQAVFIQKVSVQISLNSSPPQMALNKQ